MAELQQAHDAGPEGPEADRDVVAGFPVKRFLGRIFLGNMMFFGGWFVVAVLVEIPSVFAYSDNLRDCIVQIGSFTADLIDDVLDGVGELVGALLSVFRFGSFDDDWWTALFFLVFLHAPGTLIGVGWYLVGRWHESVLLKKRRQAMAAQGLAQFSSANSVIPPLH